MQTACTQTKFIAFCCSLLAFHPKGLESFAEINGDSCSTKGKENYWMYLIVYLEISSVTDENQL